ncbi:MAG: hypothetical protein KA191_02695 [Verrucomicrobia bacterium]|nr:hypothetical protein [Verrucomicrobiota bacterium]MDI9379457.1 hypothetical protein [Verrucomicrobiota bacterium]NMD19480.1 hypothetical protein [Verrucomicrobiota bacterium]HNV00567.1 hypothetical protein [Verrucomicrobiota bacterium]HOA61623.1 hypothetical protein [Verrucomicrobiota bacterium]
MTLTALANLLNRDSQDIIGKADYWKTFQCYLRSHRFRQLPPQPAEPGPTRALSDIDAAKPSALNDGEVRLDCIETRQPWIDENLNPNTGDWIARTLLKQRRQPPDERGKDYNHSTFCDLVITGLVGLRPRPDDIIEVNPLVSDGTWDYFCLDGVRYHGRMLTILYDRTGTRYDRGVGLQVLVDGQSVARSDSLKRITAPAAHAGSP